LKQVEKALRDAKLDKKQIDEIVLVGGSTGIPKIQQLLQTFFNGKELNKSINPLEAVAYGAAVQAAILTGDKSEIVQDMLLLDVTPFSLGIETSDGAMTALIKRNTTIPTKQSAIFELNEIKNFNNNQSGVFIRVYEGEYAIAKENNLLGEFELSEIHSDSVPTELPQIEIIFVIDANSILYVSATNKSTNNIKKITITNDKGRLSREEIEEMVANAEKYKREDESQRERIASKNSLEAYCFNMKQTMEEEKRKMVETVNGAFKWMEANQQTVQKRDYDRKLKEIEGICLSSITKMLQVAKSEPTCNN
jgi:heat shock protein 1/8